MKRSFLAAVAPVAAAAVVAAPASASEIQVGVTSAAPVVAPACPAGVSQLECKIVLTQVTALETVRAGVDYPTTVTKAGSIVAFTLGISSLSTNRSQVKSDISYLNSQYGGDAQAELTVLRPVGKPAYRRWTVAAQSADFHLQPYLGQVVEFPLPAALPVVPGEALALTVPTWAPVLSFDLTPGKYAYRQSRRSDCGTTPVLEAQQAIGSSTEYQCDYAGTRVEYSATEVTSPAPTVTDVEHGHRRQAHPNRVTHGARARDRRRARR